MSPNRPHQDLPISSLRVVLAFTDELTRSSGIEDVFRHAVEFAKNNLGLERCSVFVEDAGVMRGTFGTNLRGEITDEHKLWFPLDDAWSARIDTLKASGLPWTTVAEMRREWDGEQSRPIGEGWIALTPIRSGQRLIGVFFNDGAISGRAVNPATQELLSVFCSLLGNIVERKRAENALAEERNLLRTLIDAVPDYIFAKDTHGRFILSNKAHALAANVPDSEALVDKTASDLYPLDLAAQFDQDDRTVLQTGQALVNAERVSLDASHHLVDVLTTKVPLRDAQGSLIGLVGISRNITAYKNVQTVLQQQQAYLRRVIDAIPDHLFVKNWDGNYSLVNQALAEFYGTTVEAMVEGRDRGFENPPEELEHFVRDDREVMTTRKPKVVPEETVTDVPTGRSHTLRTIKVPLLSADESAWQVLGVSVDVTERRRTERELKASEERYRTVTELISDYAFSMRVDPDGTLVHEWITTDSFMRLTGYTVEEIGNTLKLYHPDDVEAVQRKLREVFNGKSVNHECRIITKDGQIRWLYLRYSPVPDAMQNRVVRYYGAAQDITERKRAEEAQILFRTLLDHSNDAIEVTDPATRRFVDVNETACLSLGYTREEYLNLTIAEIDPLHATRSWEEIGQALQRSGSVMVESLHRRKDGSVFPVELNINAIRLDREYLLTVVRDITERKQAEEVQRAAERMHLALEKEKELGDLKTKLMITISHEFRTPLTIAYTSAQLLEKYYERMSVAQRETHLQQIDSQINKLTWMLGDISLIIQARFERLSLNLEPANLRNLCMKIIDELQEFDDSQQRIVVTIDKSVPDLNLDVRRMRSVLTSLLSNALKYSDKATKVSLDLQRENEGVLIQITDQGIGIPLEDQPQIFEPFYRGRNVDAIEGVGLGLSIVKDIVEMHQGTVRLKSELNRGTQISVFLPEL